MSFMKKSKFNRDSLREEILPLEVRGTAEGIAGMEQLNILIWDVSETGMGIWTPQEVEMSAEIKITLLEPFAGFLVGEVMWVEEFTHGWRFGLDVTDGQRELITLFAKFQTAKSELSKITN
jgi:hypothetical protein